MSCNWGSIWEDFRFWRRNWPSQHFDTPGTLAAPLLARWLIRTARDFGCTTIVEIGFGNGHIQTEIARLAPTLTRIGVDIRPAPGLECRQLIQEWDTSSGQWLTGSEDSGLDAVLRDFDQPVLAFAVEWLDDLVGEIAHRDARGDLRTLGPSGLLAALGSADAAWAAQWWPQPGTLTVGRTRDAAWSWLARHLPPRSMLATIDYGHVVTDRPADGGFLAHRDGRSVPPEEGANLTASVAVDSLAAAVEMIGCERLACARLAELPKDHWAWPTDDPLTTLALRSQEQLLRDPRRFGHFWLVQHLTPPGEQSRGHRPLIP